MKNVGKLSVFQVYRKGQKDPIEVTAEKVINSRMGDGALVFMIGEDSVAEFPGKEVQGWQKVPAKPSIR